jgi:hypothetical protein
MVPKAETAGVVMTTGPLMIDILGSKAPALSMLVGLIAVILTRVMLVSTEPRTKAGWWYYNVSLTILLTLIVFVVILDRHLGPGTAVILGIGTGAGGILIVDAMKGWVIRFFGAWNTVTEQMQKQEKKP